MRTRITPYFHLRLSMRLIQPLPEQPADIIGDIHGEYGALMALLDSLGYSDNGSHKQGRKLIFTGDLVDRGPDSPAVMEKVMQLVESGVAYCVLGNHELNILRGVGKGGNEWLLGDTQHSDSTANHKIASADQRQRFLKFLDQQPFVLDGPHLRIVHACWNAAAVDSLRKIGQENLTINQIYNQIEQNIVKGLDEQPARESQLQELARYSTRVSDPDWDAMLLPGHVEVAIAFQMQNPFRILTTSEEKVTQTPYWAGGKWRMTERSRWWDNYSERVPVVIGHFWRLFNQDAKRIAGMFGPDVFEGIESHDWMGKHHNVYCVDYSVGQRHLERRQNDGEDFHGKLAALRYPEWEVMQDDGVVIPVGPPGP